MEKQLSVPSCQLLARQREGDGSSGCWQHISWCLSQALMCAGSFELRPLPPHLHWVEKPSCSAQLSAISNCLSIPSLL